MFQVIVILVCLASIRVDSAKPLFRSDYDYSEEAAGWLKLQRVSTTWLEAHRRCHDEGTTLASPINAGLLQAMKKLMKDYSLTCGVHTGLHDTYTPGSFFSIEGVPLHKVPANWHSNTNRSASRCQEKFSHHVILNYEGSLDIATGNETRPYFCYKKYEELNASIQCGTFDKEYIYYSETGSCYKIHLEQITWLEAEKKCTDEGGHLAIINSQAEAKILKEMYQEYSKGNPYIAFRSLVGITKWERIGWLTMHGETLYGSAPDIGTSSTCGAISRMAEYEAVSCTGAKYTFVCERSPVVAEEQKQ